jgi:molecular chaperone DnaJ
MAERDFYKVLGVARSASQDDIRKAYRKLARRYHPDVNQGNKEAESRFKDISAAYDVLGDADKRKLYDEFGEASLAPGFDAAKARAYQQWQHSGGFGPARGAEQEFDLGDFGDMFGDLGGFFRGGRRTRSRGPARGQDIEAALEIDFLDAVRGFTTTLNLQRASPCPSCKGTGIKSGASCPACGGQGRILRTETVTVNIPPGAEAGKRIRVPGKGDPGTNGGPAGNLYILPRIRPHPLLTRSGNDITMEVPITVGEAIGGASIDVPTPSGTVKVRIPPGAQSGQLLRVKGKGVSAHGRAAAGDLYLRLMVRVPKDGISQEIVRRIDDAYEENVRKDLRL